MAKELIRLTNLTMEFDGEKVLDNINLYINDKETTAMAYTTYFGERNRYEDFIRAGYRIFFVNASFTSLPINSAATGFTPFRIGVFENGNEDYSEFESGVEKILSLCPDAVIFPRLYVSMPKDWIESHPEETVFTEPSAKTTTRPPSSSISTALPETKMQISASTDAMSKSSRFSLIRVYIAVVVK